MINPKKVLKLDEFITWIVKHQGDSEKSQMTIDNYSMILSQPIKKEIFNDMLNIDGPKTIIKSLIDKRVTLERLIGVLEVEATDRFWSQIIIRNEVLD